MIIKELERILSCTLKKLSSNSMPSKGYTIKDNKVTGISLCNCNISNLTLIVSLMENLDHLSILYLSLNQITDVAPLAKLKAITKLDLRNNKIVDITKLSFLSNVQTLYLSTNLIKDFSSLKALTHLSYLDLRNNQITELPIWITKSALNLHWGTEKMKGEISLGRNPIIKPPIEIAKLGKRQIADWFNANIKPLNEIKIILLGEPKAGKTSLLRRLKDNTFNENEVQTDGVNIVDIQFGKCETFKEYTSLANITGHFWDFGGQEIMNSTHQFFLTSRSVYVLVLESRKDTNVSFQIRQWLKRIKATGGNSPIIIVANKIDINPGFGFENTFELLNEFPQIKKFIKVSCLNNETIEELKKMLEELIPTVDLFKTEIDERWISIKEKLQEDTRSRYYVDENRFKEICEECGLTEKNEQKDAINFFNDLGLVLHFPDLHLAEYYVLDPCWITYGVYQIITSTRAAQQKGIVRMEDLDMIINEEKDKSASYHSENYKKIEYSTNQRHFLVDILNCFKLCYYLPNHDQFIIPDLLDTTEPEELTMPMRLDNESINFIYEYEYLTKSTMPFIMVETNSMIQHMWRTGCILQYKNCRALVRNYKNEILLTVVGEPIINREFMAIIRNIIDSINNKLSDKPKQLIPLPGTNEFVDFEKILAFEKSGNKTYDHYDSQKGIIEKFDISKLLEGIPSQDEVKIIREILDEVKKINDKLDANFQYLIDQPVNGKIKDEIILMTKELVLNQQKEIIDEFMQAFVSLEDKMDDNLKGIYSALKKTDNLEMKLKVGIPFINLLGVNLEAEFDIKNWAKTMYEKYKLNIFKLMGK